MALLNSDDLAEEIRRFIEDNDSPQNENSTAENNTSSSQQQPAQTQQRTTVTINYKGSNIVLELIDASPDKIKTNFKIKSGTLELNRKGKVYKENDDDEFEPPLGVGTYNLTVIEQKISKTNVTQQKPKLKPKKKASSDEESEEEEEDDVTFYSCDRSPVGVSLDDDGTVNTVQIKFFKSSHEWTSAFIVNENTGTLTAFKQENSVIKCEKGTKYAVLYYCKEKTHQQLKLLKNKNVQISSEKSSKSLSEVSMARATVFWIAFPRIFYALSKIDEDLQLQNDISKYDALICPGSLKASLFQMAYSINSFVKLQVFNAAYLAKNKKIRDNHYETSMTNLLKMKSEVNDFIKVLIEYLRKNEQSEATVILISQLKELEQQDKKVEDKRNEYNQGKVLSDLMEINTSTILWNDKQIEDSLRQLVAQRAILNPILESVNEMISGHNFDIPKILNLLKCLKELICAEIIHFLHADAVSKCSEPDADEDISFIKEQYKNFYEVWRIIGISLSLLLNFEQGVNWKFFKNDILSAQRVAEATFHEISNHLPGEDYESP